MPGGLFNRRLLDPLFFYVILNGGGHNTVIINYYLDIFFLDGLEIQLVSNDQLSDIIILLDFFLLDYQ